jgi:hypothetical protein
LIHPPEGSCPYQLVWKTPVRLSLPVIVPDAVVPVPAIFPAAAAVVDSSSFEHDVNITATLQIKTIQNSNFFIITSFIIEKCRIIPTFMHRVWC